MGHAAARLDGAAGIAERGAEAANNDCANNNLKKYMMGRP
jgi:hypothetical protein